MNKNNGKKKSEFIYEKLCRAQLLPAGGAGEGGGGVAGEEEAVLIYYGIEVHIMQSNPIGCGYLAPPTSPNPSRPQLRPLWGMGGAAVARSISQS